MLHNYTKVPVDSKKTGVVPKPPCNQALSRQNASRLNSTLTAGRDWMRGPCLAKYRSDAFIPALIENSHDVKPRLSPQTSLILRGKKANLFTDERTLSLMCLRWNDTSRTSNVQLRNPFCCSLIAIQKLLSPRCLHTEVKNLPILTDRRLPRST